jgi:hypothetical protein
MALVQLQHSSLNSLLFQRKVKNRLNLQNTKCILHLDLILSSFHRGFMFNQGLVWTGFNVKACSNKDIFHF